MKYILLFCILVLSAALEIDYEGLGKTYAELYFRSYSSEKPIDLRWFEHVAHDIYGDVLDRCEGAGPRVRFWKGVGDGLTRHYADELDVESWFTTRSRMTLQDEWIHLKKLSEGTTEESDQPEELKQHADSFTRRED